MDTLATPEAAERTRRKQRFDELAEKVVEFDFHMGVLLEGTSESDGLMSRPIQGVAEAWASIMSDEGVRQAYINATPPMRRNLLYDELLDEVEESISYLRENLDNPSDVERLNAHITKLEQELKAAIRRALLTDFPELPNDLRRALRSRLSLVRKQLEVYGLYKRVRDAADRAEDSAAGAAEAEANAANAAGNTGDVVLSSFYNTMAVAEKTSANTFRWLTVFLSLIGGGVALMFVLGPSTGISWLAISSTDYAPVIQRVLLVGAVLGLAGYFARQATQHRSMANWAGSLAVQLQTFEAYLAAVDDAKVKNELRKSFAARVFGDHPAMKGEPTAETSSPALDAIAALAAKFTGSSK